MFLGAAGCCRHRVTVFHYINQGGSCIEHRLTCQAVMRHKSAKPCGLQPYPLSHCDLRPIMIRGSSCGSRLLIATLTHASIGILTCYLKSAPTLTC